MVEWQARSNDRFQIKMSDKVTNTPEYQVWMNMKARCMPRMQAEWPRYLGCTASDLFHSFQLFAEWAATQYGWAEGYHLDKDILVPGNKVYSEVTCCFVPPEINNMFTKREADRGQYPIGVHFHKQSGKFAAKLNINKKRKDLGHFKTPEEAFEVYKKAKEAHIINIANEFKDTIDPRIYTAMINYEVV